MDKAIYFDMDGTLNRFYEVEGWLEMLQAEDPTPYAVAAPRLSFSLLARRLNQLQKLGWHIGIVSWLSRSGSPAYNQKITETKLAYLRKHMPSVNWDSIAIMEYGTCKATCIPTLNGILFDDEARNRHEWFAEGGLAFGEDNILEVLALLVSGIEFK